FQSVPGGGAVNQTISVPITPVIASPRTLTFSSRDGYTLSLPGTISGDGSFGTGGNSTIALSGNISGFTGLYAAGGGRLKFDYASPTTIPNNLTASGATTIQNVGKMTWT